MYQRIHEKIQVIGVYKYAQFMPMRFLWRQAYYKIAATTLLSDIKEGQCQKRLYSVLVKGNCYRLLFDRDEETWFLEELWYDS